MKRTRVFPLLLILLLFCSGCASSIHTHSITQEYLQLNGVTDSCITDIEYKPIVAYRVHLPAMPFSYLSTRIDEFLPYYYDVTSCTEDPITDGVGVSLELSIYDQSHKMAHEDSAVFLIGSSILPAVVENALRNASINTEIIVPLHDTDNGFYSDYPNHTFAATVKGIFRYTELPDTAQELANNNLFSIFELYEHLYLQKKAEFKYEHHEQEKLKFYNSAFEHCQFNILHDDIKAYALKIVNEYGFLSESYDMTVEEYYEEFLSQSESDFFLECTTQAEWEIKKSLLIATLAVHEGIDVTEEALQHFCEKNKVDTDDDESMIYAKYYCLEELVLANHIQEEQTARSALFSCKGENDDV